MPTITNTVVLAAGADQNLISGSQYEYLPNDAMVEFGILGSAAGGLVTFISGSDLLAQEAAIPIGAANAYPKYPDDFHWSDEAAAGDRLTFRVRNTTGGNLTFTYVVKLTWM